MNEKVISSLRMKTKGKKLGDFMFISVFCFQIFFGWDFESFWLRKLFFKGGILNKFGGRLTVRGGGSGQSVSLLSGGGGSKIGKNSVS